MRKEFDQYRLRTRYGDRVSISTGTLDPVFDTYDHAAAFKLKIERDYLKDDLVVCHEEVYKYFDNGLLVKEEIILSVVRDTPTISEPKKD